MLLQAGTMLMMPSPAHGAWPEISWPAGLRSEPAPQDLRYNGVPMRVWEFSSRDPLPRVVAHFATVLGAGHYRQQRGASVVLGRQEADWLIHVQLAPDLENMRDADIRSAGTSGRVAVTDLSRGRKPDQRSQFTDPFDSTHFLGSRVLSDIRDLGADRDSRHIVYSNGHSLKTNRETLVRLMARRGFALEVARARDGATGAITLLFRGQGREATAVIRRHRGETGVVLHTLVRNDELEGYRP